jgi:hypothetical protein
MFEMKSLRQASLGILMLCLMLLIGLNSSVGVSAELPNPKLPVLITSAGQCPQADVLSMLADLAGLKYDLCSMPTVEMLAAGVGLGGSKKANIGTDLKAYPPGTKYKTVFITMGASMKGMGAAGINADYENKRVVQVVSWFKKQGVYIIGVHIAGDDRRHHYLSEGMIDRVAPYCNLMLIAKSSDADGRFTTISKKQGIPMVLVDFEFDLVDVISKLFKLP